MLAREQRDAGSLGMITAMPAPRHSSQYSVRSVDGVRLNLRSWGEGVPRYFLIHGFGEGSFSWQRFACSLSRSGGALAIDLRGHGDSERDPDATYCPERYVEDVEWALRTRGLRDIVLIGHSMGAAIAIHAAARCADRVRGLVLVEGGPYLRRAAVARIRAEFNNQPWRYQTVEEYSLRLEGKLRLACAALLRDVAPEALQRSAQGGWELKCDPALSNSPEYIDDAEVSKALARISCPVLLIRGAASSVLSRAAAERVVAETLDGRLRSVPGAGHAVMFDNPEGLLAAVTPFLGELHRPALAAS